MKWNTEARRHRVLYFFRENKVHEGGEKDRLYELCHLLFIYSSVSLRLCVQ